MKTIKCQPLTKEAFAPFGEYYQMDKPDGYPLTGEIHKFYPDRVTCYQGHNVAFSPLVVTKPEKMIVTKAEYHTTTCEVLMPITDDMILHVAPPSAGEPIIEHTKAFIVPKNTVVKINACVWHLAPLPVNKDEITVMIVLPECTYINDCTVVDFKQEDHFIIEK